MFFFFSIVTTLGVNAYGEIEYYFGMFKFISLIVLFFIAILADVGAFGNGYVGFRYWREPYGKCILDLFIIFFICRILTHLEYRQGLFKMVLMGLAKSLSLLLLTTVARRLFLWQRASLKIPSVMFLG